ncbi:MAG: choloylglycine hydrolase family protein [Ruminococcaceae bacterium]|nr:choloylglycine hydrolase family protein [Oscillospiraceae bacterium]
MCTALSYKTNFHYFGRNLDYEHSFGEKVIITPRNYPISFKCMDKLNFHYAFIGIGIVEDNFPLYFDLTNEKGLSVAGLNFPNNAYYSDYCDQKINLAPYEMPLYILSKCSDVYEANNLLRDINLIKKPFNMKHCLTPLHFIFSDKNKSIVYETTKEGNFVYENDLGVLTNNPTFNMQKENLINYLNLSPKEPVNLFSDKIDLVPSSRGMGAIGLPGDLSSSSRFVRAAFTKLNSPVTLSDEEGITQFFHILNSVYQTKGSVCLSDNLYENTIYSSCCNTDEGIYYYTTYNNSRITRIDMYKENLEGDNLITYNMINHQDILCGN